MAVAQGITASSGFNTLGAGVSFHDFNNDGWDDLTFTSGNGSNLYFYQNNGGSFSPISLISNTAETKEAIWVDYDNDGDKDLFVTSYNAADKLYRNQGGMNLVDVTATAFDIMGNLPSFGAVWGDYDRDGWLDLYVVHYDSPPNSYNHLYHSNGDGTFTRQSSTHVTIDGGRPSFDACFLDYNNDEWLDLYIANDKYESRNSLYQNVNGNFTNGSEASGTGVYIDAMNAGGADYDDDGDVDLYVTNFPDGNIFIV